MREKTGPGERFPVLPGGKYEVLGEAGAGGGGTVFQVHDLRLGKDWAAKRVEKGRESIEEQVLGKVSSPAFVRIVDVEEDGDARWLIMDWVEGETLQSRLQREGRLGAGEAARIGLEICRALSCLHAMQPPILYLDCKPANIMLDQEGRVRLVDFGSAIVADGGNAPKSGSFGFGAPEQLAADGGLRRADERSDIFSLGRTLYVMLGGADPAKPPFARQRLRDCNSAIPKGLAQTVEKCMEADPAGRYQTMDALGDALEDALKRCRGGFLGERLRRIAASVVTGSLLLASAWQWGRFLQGFAAADVFPSLKRSASFFWEFAFGHTGTLDSARFLWRTAAEKCAAAQLLPCAGWGLFWLILVCLWQGGMARRRRRRVYWEPVCNLFRTEKLPSRWPLAALLAAFPLFHTLAALSRLYA